MNVRERDREKLIGQGSKAAGKGNQTGSNVRFCEGGIRELFGLTGCQGSVNSAFIAVRPYNCRN